MLVQEYQHRTKSIVERRMATSATWNSNPTTSRVQARREAASAFFLHSAIGRHNRPVFAGRSQLPRQKSQVKFDVVTNEQIALGDNFANASSINGKRLLVSQCPVIVSVHLESHRVTRNSWIKDKVGRLNFQEVNGQSRSVQL